MKLVWYRNDLRIQDHRPLSQALASGEPVVALYLLCSDQWQDHGVAPLRRWYVLNSLQELGERLAALGVALHVRDAGGFQQVPQVLAGFVREQGVNEVFCNREYPLNEINRDRQVVQVLETMAVPVRGFDDGVLVPPRALRTGKGTPYTVFGAYKRRWDQWLDQHFTAPGGEPPARSPAEFVGRACVEQALAALELDQTLTDQWHSGESAARQRLSHFVETALAGYQRQRDFPAQSATSGLSAALSAGTLSVARCYQAARLAMTDPGQREGARCWINELAWRDFYRQIMAQFPVVSRGQPFRPETRWLQWQQDEALFQAWCEGRTGYPLVDAAMRQLNASGWMHNRLRMVTAMFLSKHLWLDWRRGEAYFMARLMDGDFAANNGGWQWCASTGTDAVPYFRVFNPVRQSQRFDPDGAFIRRWVPELGALDNKSVHEPWKQPLLAPDYPPPIVPHQGVRERVTAAFKAAKQQHELIMASAGENV